VEVEEYYALMTPVPVIGDGWKGTTKIWAERLRVLDKERTQVLATYGNSNGWLDRQPAITRHSSGKGIVTFFGAYLDDVSQLSLLQTITQEAGIQPVMVTPSGVEACKRVDKNGGEVIILINHNRSEQQIFLPWPAHEYLSGRTPVDELILEPYGVAVLTRA
jgi:beta-galactosidase